MSRKRVPLNQNECTADFRIGVPFEQNLQNGDHVKKGQLLVSFDMEKVKAAGYDVTTPLIVTNSDDYKDVKILSEDSVTPSDKVLEIVK